MKDKNTIINRMMDDAADVMQAKLEYNELVAEQMQEKGKVETAAFLRKQNERIQAAIDLIRQNEGCWA